MRILGIQAGARMKARTICIVVLLGVIVLAALWIAPKKTDQVPGILPKAKVSSKTQSKPAKLSLLSEAERVRLQRKEAQEKFVQLVRQGEVEQAARMLGENGVHTSVLSGEISRMETALRTKAAPVDSQECFNVMDFMLKKGQIGNIWNSEKVFADYKRLLRELNIPDTEAAFLPSTQHLFVVRVPYSPMHDEAKWQSAFVQCIAVLEARPDDVAAWRGLENIASSPTKHWDRPHLKPLLDVCTTADSRYRMAKLAIKVCHELEFVDECVESALPHLPNDSLRSGLLFDSIRPQKLKRFDVDRSLTIANRIVDDYPKTHSARWALSSQLQHLGRTDVRDALAKLDSLSDVMSLTSEEVAFQKLAIAGSPYHGRLEDYEYDGLHTERKVASEQEKHQQSLAKELLDQELIETPGAYQRSSVGLRTRIAQYEKDSDAIETLAGKWLKLPKADWLSSEDLAPSFAAHYAAKKDWAMAYKAWEKWPASNGGCGTWDVFPSEYRVVHLANCLLHQGKHAEAVDLIVQEIASGKSESQALIPILLYQIYRRAGQSEDYWAIVDAWLTDPNHQESFTPYGKFSFFKMKKMKDQLRKLQSLAEANDWSKLEEIRAQDLPKSSSYSPEYRTGFMLETDVGAHVTILLADYRDGGQILLPPEMTTPKLRLQHPKSEVVREYLQWPWPPTGSLLKTLELKSKAKN